MTDSEESVPAKEEASEPEATSTPAEASKTAETPVEQTASVSETAETPVEQTASVSETAETPVEQKAPVSETAVEVEKCAEAKVTDESTPEQTSGPSTATDSAPDESSTTTTTKETPKFVLSKAPENPPAEVGPRQGSTGCLPPPISGRVTANGGIVATWDLRRIGRKPQPRDWVGLYVHHRSRRYIFYAYTNGKATGSCTFLRLKPGYYDLRLFADDTYDEIGRTKQPILLGPSVPIDAQLSQDGSLVCVAVDSVTVKPQSMPETRALEDGAETLSAPGIAPTNDSDLKVLDKGNWFGLFNCEEHENYTRNAAAFRYVSHTRCVKLPVGTPATVQAALKAIAEQPPPFAPANILKKKKEEKEGEEEQPMRDVYFTSFALPPRGVYEVRFFFNVSSSLLYGNLFSGIVKRIQIQSTDEERMLAMLARPLFSHKIENSKPYGFEDKPAAESLERFALARTPRENWTAADMKSRAIVPGTVSQSTVDSEKYVMEASYDDVTHDVKDLNDEDIFDHWRTVAGYIHFFLNQARPHVLAFSVTPRGNPVVLAIEETLSPSNLRRVIMWTPKNTKRFLAKGANATEIAKTIGAGNPEYAALKWTLSAINNPARGLLYEFDSVTTVIRQKYGVLYAAPGQVTEREMLRNDYSATSPAFQHFLDFLGERVTLKGFNKFSGGLDVSGSNNTGETSVFTEYGQGPVPMSIMFHVSPLIPLQSNDAQCVDRKRHIGNDVCVLIFKDVKDDSDNVAIDSFVSHFNTVFAIITPVTSEAPVKYRVTFVYKKAMRPFPPYFPKAESGEYLFEESPLFREWLLQKLINGERSAMQTPEFRRGHTASRSQMLMEVIKACQDARNDQVLFRLFR